MHKNKKELYLIILLLLMTIFMQIPQNSEEPVFYAAYNIFVLITYTCITTLWRASIQRRVFHRMMKMHADGIVFLMLVWIVARTLRYTVFFQVEPWERWCWYIYYIPMIIIPMFCFMSARCLGEPEDWKPEKKFYFMYMPAFLMIFGVLTNDIHQLAFKIREGTGAVAVAYKRGVLYYCIIVWAFALSIAMLINLLRKFRIPGTKKVMWFPILALLIGMVVSMAYIANQLSGFVEFSIISCVVIITAWESCIWTGLMPSNTYYEEMLYESTISAQIIDENNQICYAAKKSIHFPEEIIEQAKKKIVFLDENTRLRCEKISGGYVLWTEDVAVVNVVLSELEEIGQNLSENNDLLSAEIALKQKKAKIDEKNKLYDRIAGDIERQLDYIRNMLSNMTPEDEMLELKFAIIVIIGAYIKRRTNLLLLREESRVIPAEELSYCIRESVECMKGCNIACSFESHITGMMDVDVIVLIYNVFQRTVEKALNDIRYMLVSLSEENHYIYLKMILQDFRELLPKDYCKEEISRYNGILNVEEIEGEEYVVLRIPKGAVR